eukprot:85673-Rhodomonas_salina.1
MIDGNGWVVPEIVNLPDCGRFADHEFGPYKLLEEIRNRVQKQMLHHCSLAYCKESGNCRFAYPMLARSET